MIFETPEDPQKGPWVRVTHNFLNFVLFRGGPGTPSGPRTETWKGPGGGPGGPFLVPKHRFVIFAPPGLVKTAFLFIAKPLYWAPQEIAGKRARLTEGSAGNQGVQRGAQGTLLGAPGGPRGGQGRARGRPRKSLPSLMRVSWPPRGSLGGMGGKPPLPKTV